jgi:hypothetical protein
MHQSDSAKMFTSLTQSSLVFIEPSLEDCIFIGQDSPDDDIFSAINSKSESSSSFLSSKRVKNIGTVDIPSSAKIQIENILQGSTLENCTSLEEDILNCANKYLYDQLIYSREIDDDRLSTRLSSFTSELDILNYMSLYSNDLIALDMDSIHFMLTDRSSSKSLHHLQNELISIRSLQQTMNLLREQTIQDFYSSSLLSVGSEEGKEEKEEERKTQESDQEIAEINREDPTALASTLAPSAYGEYLGFIQTGPDLYAKIANPHFLCNEKTVSSYASFKSGK